AAATRGQQPADDAASDGARGGPRGPRRGADAVRAGDPEAASRQPKWADAAAERQGHRADQRRARRPAGDPRRAPAERARARPGAGGGARASARAREGARRPRAVSERACYAVAVTVHLPIVTGG